jgi:hypothetical protein
MKRCYKCQKPYVEPEGPGFQDVCEECSSYLHCCQNCFFYEPGHHNDCTETQTDYVSDKNGMNRCEYFRFKTARGTGLPDDNGGRRFKKADWRNLNKDKSKDRKKGGPPQRRRSTPNPFASKGGAGGGGRAQKAREALENLFKKE